MEPFVTYHAHSTKIVEQIILLSVVVHTLKLALHIMRMQEILIAQLDPAVLVQHI